MGIKKLIQMTFLLFINMLLLSPLQVFSSHITGNPQASEIEALFANKNEWEEEYKAFPFNNMKNPHFIRLSTKCYVLLDAGLTPAFVEYFKGLYHFYEPGGERYKELDENSKGYITLIGIQVAKFLKP